MKVGKSKKKTNSPKENYSLIYLPTSKNYFHNISSQEDAYIANILWEQSSANELRNDIEDQISMLPILKNIKEANLTTNDSRRQKLTDKIIQVSEYPINNSS